MHRARCAARRGLRRGYFLTKEDVGRLPLAARAFRAFHSRFSGYYAGHEDHRA